MKQEINSWKDLLIGLQDSFNIICDELQDLKLKTSIQGKHYICIFKEEQVMSQDDQSRSNTATFNNATNLIKQEIMEECQVD